MKKEDVYELAQNPNFISGIHSFCDRWCERCPFTARCMNYAMGEEWRREAGEEPDITQDAFWEQFADMMRLTGEMLQEMIAEQGIDLDSVTDEEWEAIDAKRKADDDYADTHPLTKAASAYRKKADEWFESAESVFLKKEEELNAFVRLNITAVNPEEIARQLKDAVDVIQWYFFFIEVKLTSALRSHLSEEREPKIWEDEPKHSQGTAKVALIAIDRTIIAWDRLYHQFSEREDETLAILVQLERLRRRVEQEFPYARAFVRPGFDD